MDMEVYGIVFGRLSNLQCYQQHPGEERRLSDMFTLMMYVVQGIRVVLERTDLDYGKQTNEELSIVLDLDLDTRLIDVKEDEEATATLRAERGAEILSSLEASLVNGLNPTMPSVVEEGLKTLARAWNVEIGWEMISPTKVRLTISHLLASFIDYVEEARERPTLFLGLTDGDEIDMKSDEWAYDQDSFLDHFGRGIVEYIDRERLVATLSAGEDRRHRLAIHCGFDLTEIEP